MSTRRMMSSRQDGFTIIEAIIVLLIASLILSVVLPTVSRAVSDNIRMGMRGLDTFSLSIAENSFRRLAAATVPPAAVQFEPLKLDTLSGDGTAASFFVLASQSVPCAPRGRLTEIKLTIEAAPSGGRLICRSIDGVSEITRWDKGSASFRYSLDGHDWGDVWPPPASGVKGRKDEQTDLLEVPRRPSVVAPLLRFSINDVSTDRVPWVVQIGQPVTAELRVDDLLGTVGSQGEASAIP